MNFKTIILSLSLLFVAVIAFGQKSFTLNKPVSETDKKKITGILSAFDTNSYQIDIKSEEGRLSMGNAKGLSDVAQKNTVRPINNGTFKSGLCTNINIFKQGRFTKDQMSQMDKLYKILNKYQ